MGWSLSLLQVRYDTTAIDRNRLVSIGGVVVVHLLLIAFILSGLPKFAPVPRSVHEMILVLMPKAKRIEPTPREKILRPPAVLSPRLPRYMPAIEPLTAPATAPTTKALIIPLLRCAPENLEKLAPEERENCSGAGIAPPDGSTIAELRSHVREPERHAAELAARKTPATVDCTHLETQVIDNIAQDNAVFVDPVCAARKVWRALGR